MKTLIAYGLLALSAALVGRTAHRTSAPPAEPPICAGGMTNPLSLDVLPTQVDRLPQGERLTFAVRLTHQLRGEAKIRYAVELLDDTGRAVAPVMSSAIQELRPSAVLQGSDVVLPEGLADGDYQIRITAAAKSNADGEPSTLIHTVYLRRRAGAFSELSAGQWFQSTRANAAQLLPGPVLSPARTRIASQPAPSITICPSPLGAGGMTTSTICPPLDPPPVASGNVNGQLAFFNHQGNFCPTTRDCYGAKYTQAEFNAVLPIRETRVYVRRASDARIIGQGATDGAGNFSIGWTISNFSGDVSADLIWVGEHKDGRFAIRSDTGARYVFWTYPFTLRDGGSDFIGTLVWGDAQNPNQLANVYDGAWRAWTEFSLSNRMLNYFNNVEVRAFVTDTDCDTSCAFGAQNLIKLDPDAAYQPQGRVMHEMGHIASYRSNRDQQRIESPDYCFPNQGGGCRWNLTEPEWSSAAFEEALATFYADTGLYYPWARAPHSCISTLACADGLFNIEESHAQCAAGENRWPVTTMRYLWDAFDSNVDIAGETLQRNNFEFFDTINAFDNGNGNHQKDEPICCDFFSGCSLCRRDGRAASDFRWNWANWGTDSTFAFTNNCSPVGD